VVASIDLWLDKPHGSSMLDLFESLSHLGYDVKVLIPSNRDVVMNRNHLRVETVRVGRWLPAITLIHLYSRFLRSTLREVDLSAMIADNAMLPILFLVRLLNKTKGVMLIMSRPVGVKGLRGKVVLLRFRFFLMLAKYLVGAVTATSPYEAKEFSRYGNIPAERMSIISSPISEIFADCGVPTDRKEIRRKLGMHGLTGKKIVLHHGVLDESRRISEVVMAFAEAFRDREDIVLLLVGDGPARHSLEAQIRRNAIKNCVVAGPVQYSTVPEMISACDLGLVLLPDHPWWRYSAPTKLIELLVMGKPVVASDLPGIRWIAGDCALVTYVRSFKAEALRAAIQEALAQEHRISCDARARYFERFSSKAFATRLDSIIRQQS